MVWMNRTLVQAPRNGTTSHTVTFTPAAAGNLLVAVVDGSVTSTTPTGWTLPSGGSAVEYTGLYVWWKIATAGESQFATTHNGGDYAVVFAVYEFPAGSAFVKSASGTGVGMSAANPALSGLTGTNMVMAVKAGTVAQTYTYTGTTWTGMVEDFDVTAPFSVTDGYRASLAYLDGFTGTSSQPTGVASGTTVISEALTFAVNVAQPASFPTDGRVTASSIATGQVTARKPLTGVTVTTGAVAGFVAAALAIGGTTSSTTTVTGDVGAAVGATGVVESTSAVTGHVTAVLPVAGNLATTSTITGDATAILPTRGTAGAVSSVTGTMEAEDGLTGQTGATSTVSGDVTAMLTVAGRTVTTSTVVGVMDDRGLTGHVTGTSSTDGAVAARFTISGVTVTVSTVTGHMQSGEPDPFPTVRTLTITAPERTLTATTPDRTLTIDAPTHTLEWSPS